MLRIYSLPTLPVGMYDVEISHLVFKTYRKIGLGIDANSSLRLDAVLEVGATYEKVWVLTEPSRQPLP